MKSLKSFAIVMLVMTVLFSGCGNERNEVNQSELIPVKLSLSQRKTVSMYNDLGINVFTQLDSGVYNKVISPLFLNIALGAQANLQSAVNAEAIANSLGVGSVDELNELNRLLRESLPKVDKTANIEFYSNLWVSGSKFPGIESKRNVFEGFYSCPVNIESNWKKETVGNAVVEWSKKYNAAISGASIAADTVRGCCVQANIIKFKGIWAQPWNPNDTKKEDFTNANGTKSFVEMMYGKASKCKYQNNGNYSFVTLPFGNGGYNLVVIKTENGNKIQDVRKAIDWESVMSQVESDVYNSTVSVILPKFSVSTLSEIGVEKELALNGFKGQLYGFGASHAVDFSIDEKGAEAVIKSGLVSSSGNLETIQFKVASPFIIALIERTSKSIVLLGEINYLKPVGTK